MLLLWLQADILVSELLGSFGDNELSPECLDGAQSFLKRELRMFTECEIAVNPSINACMHMHMHTHKCAQTWTHMHI